MSCVTQVGFFDCVDDESVHDPLTMEPAPSPCEYSAADPRFQFSSGKNFGKPQNPVCAAQPMSV